MSLYSSFGAFGTGLWTDVTSDWVLWVDAAANRPILVPAQLRQEVFNEIGNIFAPLAQGWQPESHDIETEMEILAEFLLT